MSGVLSEALAYSPAGIPVGGIVASILVVAAALVVKRIVMSTLRRRASSGTGFGPSLAGNLARPLGFLVLVTGVYLALRIHDLPEGVVVWRRRVMFFLLTVNILWLLLKAVDAVAEAMAGVAADTESRMDDQLIPILTKLAKFILVAIGIIFYMQSNGYPVSGIIAGMGIGGLAMALAAQDSISGIFASVVIFLDRPFMVGDFVEIAGIVGTVEEIGIRSTRIRTVEQTLVTIPNKEVMDSNIDNFSQRPMRRTSMTIGVTYDTTADQMEALLADIRRMLAEHPEVDAETVLVNFSGFGDSSLDIDLKYFLLTVDYKEWLDLREGVNLALMRVVERHGLDFAFPSRTIYMESGG